MKDLDYSTVKLDRTIVRGIYERSKRQCTETRQDHSEGHV